MPESVLVRFTGELQPGVTLRDVVNAIPYVAMQKGLLTNDKQIEIDGSNHDCEEAKVNDDIRQERLESVGVRFLRFTNADVKRNMERLHLVQLLV